MKARNIFLASLSCFLIFGCKQKKEDPVPIYVVDRRFPSLRNKTVSRTMKLACKEMVESLDYTFEGNASAWYSKPYYYNNVTAGLTGVNEFGQVELILAESAHHNDNFTEFTFTLKDDPNMVWVQGDGKPYTINDEPQRIKASDYRYGALRAIESMSWGLSMFSQGIYLDGLAEYSIYLYIIYSQEQGLLHEINTDKKIIKYINKTIENSYPEIYQLKDYENHPLTTDDLPRIKDSSILGINTNDANRTITYKTIKPLPYFAFYLTNTPFLPYCQSFASTISPHEATLNPNKALYFGPYYASNYEKVDDVKELTLKRNNYYNAIEGISPENTANIEEIVFKELPNKSDESMIHAYESGIVDGLYDNFGSKAIYDKYVFGPDNSGSMEQPYSSETSVIFQDKVSGYYGMFINLERSRYRGQNFVTGATPASIRNTTNALRLEAVRKMLLKSFDYETYYPYEYGHKHSREEIANTFVPRNYCFDDNGNEYIENYLTPTYAKKKNILLENAKEMLALGQFTHQQKSINEMDELVDEALAAIDIYNHDESLTSLYGEIEFPIYFDYYTNNENMTYSVFGTNKTFNTNTIESNLIQSVNNRINKIHNPTEEEEFPYFIARSTDLVNDTNRNDANGMTYGQYANFDISVPFFGWGFANENDPGCGLGAFTNDFSAVFKYMGEETIPNIRIVNGNAVTNNLFDTFKGLLNDANASLDSSVRFTKFAEAEYELLENLHIYAPRQSLGGGYGLVISHMTGVGEPKQLFSMINEGRLTGLWALNEPLNNDETQTLLEEEEDYQKTYNEEHPNGIYS